MGFFIAHQPMRILSHLHQAVTLRQPIVRICCLIMALPQVPFAQSTRIDTGSTWTSIRGQAQGTTYSIKYLPKDKPVTRSQIDSILSDIDRSLSLYRNDSRISVFNRTDRSILTDQHLSNVIRSALQVHTMSGGAFDIRLRRLSRAWGFGPGASQKPPSRHEIQQLLPLKSDTIWLEGDLLFKSSPKLQIDLDGIAQGYSVDVLAGFLGSQGVHHYMVELGGEIRTFGSRPDGRPWRIGVESPLHEEAANTLMVSPGNAAITTSGSYRKTRSFGGRTYSHVINPLTGRPIDNGMLACTVIAPTAMLADALDNVGMVLGPNAGLKVISRIPDAEAFFVWRDAKGIIHTQGTPGFLARVLPDD